MHKLYGLLFRIDFFFSPNLDVHAPPPHHSRIQNTCQLSSPLNRCSLAFPFLLSLPSSLPHTHTHSLSQTTKSHKSQISDLARVSFNALSLSSSPMSPLFLFLLLLLSNPSPIFLVAGSDPLFSILSRPDYKPPPPPAPPPLRPSVSCDSAIGGAGSFDSLCIISSSVNVSSDLEIRGVGSLHLIDGVALSCSSPGCSVTIHLAGEIRIGVNSAILAGSVEIMGGNLSVGVDGRIDVTGMGGDPPAQTSGAGTGVHGDGGGHGGRGASCFIGKGETQEDEWGGDVYGWEGLMEPASFGSKGGTLSLERQGGGGGGGRVVLNVEEVIELDGAVTADGGDGGTNGGGGSGGSIYVVANKM